MEIPEIVVPEINAVIDLPQVAIPHAPPVTLDIGVPVIELPHFNPMDMEPEVQAPKIVPPKLKPAEPPAAEIPPIKLPKKEAPKSEEKSYKAIKLENRFRSVWNRQFRNNLCASIPKLIGFFNQK